MPTDIMHARLEKGYYALSVVRREGNNHKEVTSFPNLKNVTGLVLSMMTYHSDCILNRSLGGKGFSEGAGSDRVSFYHPDMHTWNLQIHFDVGLEDRALLEGIVNMHNQYQEAITKGPELPQTRLHSS